MTAALRTNDCVNLRVFIPSSFLRRRPIARTVLAQEGLRPGVAKILSLSESMDRSSVSSTTKFSVRAVSSKTTLRGYDLPSDGIPKPRRSN